RNASRRTRACIGGGRHRRGERAPWPGQSRRDAVAQRRRRAHRPAHRPRPAAGPRRGGRPGIQRRRGVLGMSTLGPRARVLVIPAATLERIVPILLKEGRVARGWLGVALHPVAVPDALRETAGQASGMMVMSLAEGGPAAKAGIVAGDIVLSVNDAAASGFRRIAGQFAADSIGRKAALRVIRGGNLLSLDAVIEARP